MAFPIDYSGKIIWSREAKSDAEDYRARFLDKVAAELEIIKAKDVLVRDNRVAFSGSMLRSVSNWNMLVPVTRGHIKVNVTGDSVKVIYNLNFKHFLVTISALILIGCSFIAFLDSTVPIGTRIGLFIPALLWASAFNYLLTVIRFPALIKRVLKSV